MSFFSPEALLQRNAQCVNEERAKQLVGQWLDGAATFTLHTSGSTGAPKPISIRRTQLLASAQATARAFTLPKGSRVLVCLHTGYVAGFMQIIRALVNEWQIWVMEPSVNPLKELPETFACDFCSLVPMQLQALLHDPSTQPRVQTLGKILLGGAPLSVSQERVFRELAIPVFQGYGMTETVSHIALRQISPSASFSTLYTAVPEIALGVDERGCLSVRGQVTQGEVVQTNDLVRLIDDRRFEWLGRVDHVVNSGGIKLHLAQIDRVIEEFMDDQQLHRRFFSWHEPDERLGQRLVLVIEGDPLSITIEEELLSRVEHVLNVYAKPRGMYYIATFVETPTQKIDRVKTYLNLTTR